MNELEEAEECEGVLEVLDAGVLERAWLVGFHVVHEVVDCVERRLDGLRGDVEARSHIDGHIRFS